MSDKQETKLPVLLDGLLPGVRLERGERPGGRIGKVTTYKFLGVVVAETKQVDGKAVQL